MHTTLGKVAAVTVGVCLAGGAGAYGVYQILDAVNEPAVVQEQPEQSEVKQQEQKEPETRRGPTGSKGRRLSKPDRRKSYPEKNWNLCLPTVLRRSLPRDYPGRRPGRS